MGIVSGVDWVGRAQTVWAFAPLWAKVAVVTALSAGLGVLQRQPWQVTLVLALLATAASLCLGFIVNDWLAAAKSKPNRKRELLEMLAILQLKYGELERRFIAQGGSQDLWNRQTGLHNTAKRVLEGELGLHYWSQFKNAKENPLHIPASFPVADDGRLNLLQMIHGRERQLGRIIEEVKAHQ